MYLVVPVLYSIAFGFSGISIPMSIISLYKETVDINTIDLHHKICIAFAHHTEFKQSLEIGSKRLE